MIADLWQSLANLREAEGRLRKAGQSGGTLMGKVVGYQVEIGGVLRTLTEALLKERPDAIPG